MRVVSILFLIALLYSPASAQNTIDVALANKKAAEKKYLKALQILAPCLDVKSVKEIANLEDCLYYGEYVAEEAVVDLNQKYGKHKAKTPPSSYGREKDFEAWLPAEYGDVGLDWQVNQWEEIEYRNEYIRRLKALFPESKYKAEVDYKIIDINAHVDKWKEWKNSLIAYLKQYPTGPYSVRAKYDLARMYYDLWGLVNPDVKEFLVVSFRSGDPVKDRADSERYRQESLRLFTEISKMPDTSIIAKSEQSELQKILTSLQKGEHATGVGCFVTRGYD